MYKAFFGLSRDPFEISPDPYFFYPTARHNEALANLYYGIRKQKGFVVVTGEVGTGKSLLVRCLMQTLRQSSVAFAYVFNTTLEPREFLEYVLADLGLRHNMASKTDLLMALHNFLLDRHRRGLTTALLVDEAQNLRPEVLEEIRLLTNLETEKQKLFQIVLVGQPELDGKMDSSELRQLKQRIGLRCKLEPLEFDEVPRYIRKRLERAGAGERSVSIFPTGTMQPIYQYSKGIPRLINTICENALLTGYAMQSSAITPEIICEVAKDFRLDTELRAPNGTDPLLALENSADPSSRKAVIQALLNLLDQPEVTGTAGGYVPLKKGTYGA
jgi:general secretion pathway protein A